MRHQFASTANNSTSSSSKSTNIKTQKTTTTNLNNEPQPSSSSSLLAGYQQQQPPLAFVHRNVSSSFVGLPAANNPARQVNINVQQQQQQQQQQQLKRPPSSSQQMSTRQNHYLAGVTSGQFQLQREQQQPVICYSRQDIQEQYLPRPVELRNDKNHAQDHHYDNNNDNHQHDVCQQQNDKTQPQRKARVKKRQTNLSSTLTKKRPHSASFFSTCFSTSTASDHQLDDLGHKQGPSNKLSLSTRHKRLLAHLGLAKKPPKVSSIVNSASDANLSSSTYQNSVNKQASRDERNCPRSATAGNLHEAGKTMSGTVKSLANTNRKHVSFENELQNEQPNLEPTLAAASNVINTNANYLPTSNLTLVTNQHVASPSNYVADASQLTLLQHQLQYPGFSSNSVSVAPAPIVSQQVQYANYRPPTQVHYVPLPLGPIVTGNKSNYLTQRVPLYEPNTKVPPILSTTTPSPQQHQHQHQHQPLMMLTTQPKTIYKKLPPLPMRTQATQTEITAFHLTLGSSSTSQPDVSETSRLKQGQISQTHKQQAQISRTLPRHTINSATTSLSTASPAKINQNNQHQAQTSTSTSVTTVSELKSLPKAASCSKNTPLVEATGGTGSDATDDSLTKPPPSTSSARAVVELQVRDTKACQIGKKVAAAKPRTTNVNKTKSKYRKQKDQPDKEAPAVTASTTNDLAATLASSSSCSSSAESLEAHDSQIAALAAAKANTNNYKGHQAALSSLGAANQQFSIDDAASASTSTCAANKVPTKLEPQFQKRQGVDDKTKTTLTNAATTLIEPPNEFASSGSGSVLPILGSKLVTRNLDKDHSDYVIKQQHYVGDDAANNDKVEDDDNDEDFTELSEASSQTVTDSALVERIVDIGKALASSRNTRKAKQLAADTSKQSALASAVVVKDTSGERAATTVASSQPSSSASSPTKSASEGSVSESKAKVKSKRSSSFAKYQPLMAGDDVTQQQRHQQPRRASYAATCREFNTGVVSVSGSSWLAAKTTSDSLSRFRQFVERGEEQGRVPSGGEWAETEMEMEQQVRREPKKRMFSTSTLSTRHYSYCSNEELLLGSAASLSSANSNSNSNNDNNNNDINATIKQKQLESIESIESSAAAPELVDQGFFHRTTTIANDEDEVGVGVGVEEEKDLSCVKESSEGLELLNQQQNLQGQSRDEQQIISEQTNLDSKQLNISFAASSSSSPRPLPSPSSLSSFNELQKQLPQPISSGSMSVEFEVDISSSNRSIKKQLTTTTTNTTDEESEAEDSDDDDDDDDDDQVASASTRTTVSELSQGDAELSSSSFVDSYRQRYEQVASFASRLATQLVVEASSCALSHLHFDHNKAQCETDLLLDAAGNFVPAATKTTTKTDIVELAESKGSHGDLCTSQQGGECNLERDESLAAAVLTQTYSATTTTTSMTLTSEAWSLPDDDLGTSCAVEHSNNASLEQDTCKTLKSSLPIEGPSASIARLKEATKPPVVEKPAHLKLVFARQRQSTSASSISSLSVELDAESQPMSLIGPLPLQREGEVKVSQEHEQENVKVKQPSSGQDHCNSETETETETEVEAAAAVAVTATSIAAAAAAAAVACVAQHESISQLEDNKTDLPHSDKPNNDNDISTTGSCNSSENEDQTKSLTRAPSDAETVVDAALALDLGELGKQVVQKQRQQTGSPSPDLSLNSTSTANTDNDLTSPTCTTDSFEALASTSHIAASEMTSLSANELQKKSLPTNQQTVKVKPRLLRQPSPELKQRALPIRRHSSSTTGACGSNGALSVEILKAGAPSGAGNGGERPRLVQTRSCLGPQRSLVNIAYVHEMSRQPGSYSRGGSPPLRRLSREDSFSGSCSWGGYSQSGSGSDLHTPVSVSLNQVSSDTNESVLPKLEPQGDRDNEISIMDLGSASGDCPTATLYQQQTGKCTASTIDNEQIVCTTNVFSPTKHDLVPETIEEASDENEDTDVEVRKDEDGKDDDDDDNDESSISVSQRGVTIERGKFVGKSKSSSLDTGEVVCQDEIENTKESNEEDENKTPTQSPGAMDKSADEIAKRLQWLGSSGNSSDDPILAHLSKSHPVLSVEEQLECVKPSLSVDQADQADELIGNGDKPEPQQQVRRGPPLAKLKSTNKTVATNLESICSSCSCQDDNVPASTGSNQNVKLAVDEVESIKLQAGERQNKRDTSSFGEASNEPNSAVLSQNYWLSWWLYVSECEEAAVWHQQQSTFGQQSTSSLELEPQISGELGVLVQNNNQDDFLMALETSSTCSEQNFSQKFKATTRKMIHRRCAMEMYSRLARDELRVEKRVELGRNKTSGSQEFGFRIHGSRPVVVSAIERGTAADTCGLRVGDLIYAINDHKILNASHTEVVRLAHERSESMVLDLVPMSGFLQDQQQYINQTQARCKIVASGHLLRLSPSTAQPALLKLARDQRPDASRVRAAMRQAWRLRFFALRADNCLYWYRKSTDVEPFGGINLQGYSATLTEEFLEPKFVIKLTKSRRQPNYIGSDNMTKVQEWIDIINKAATDANQNDPYVSLMLARASVPPKSIENPECFGYLHKYTAKKTGGAHWKCYYFVLKDACLYTYKPNNSQQENLNNSANDNKENQPFAQQSNNKPIPKTNNQYAIAVYFLHGYSVRNKHIESKKFTFELTPPNKDIIKPVFLMAQNDIEKKRWIASLEYSIDRWIEVDKTADSSY